MPGVGKIGNPAGRAIVGAIIGGTLSAATGGTFANGAVSGAVMGVMVGGMDKKVTQSNDHDELVYGEPDRRTIRNTVNRNSAIASGVSIDPSTGIMTMQVPYSVAPGTDASLSSTFEGEVESNLSQTFTKGFFRKTSITMKVDLVQGAQNSAFTFSACGVVCNDPTVQGASDSDLRTIQISPTARTGSRTHEFLHQAGLGHQWNRTNSIMSYSSGRSVKYSDVERLYEGRFQVRDATRLITGRFQVRDATRLTTAWFHSEFDPDRSVRCKAPAGCASRGAGVGGC